MRTRLAPLTMLLATAGCASGPVDLARAKIVDVRAFVSSDPTSPVTTDLATLEKMPCEVADLKVAVEVRAIPEGGKQPEVFVAGGGLTARVKADPGKYPGVDPHDALAYERSHSFDLSAIDFEAKGGFSVDRVSSSGGEGGRDNEQVHLKIDREKGAFAGFAVTVRPKGAPDKKLEKILPPNLSCNAVTRVMAPAGDLKHPSGDPGPNVAVYVTKASFTFGDAVLALVVHGSTAKYVLLDPSSKHTFVAAGGNGVEGTSAQPGGDGGTGGVIQILVDDRFAALQNQLAFEAPGGKGGRGAPDGKEGAAGQGSIKASPEVIGFFMKRKDLPAGIKLDEPPPEDPKKGPKPKPIPPKKPTK